MYIDSRSLTLHNSGLKEDVLVYKSEVIMQFRDGPGKNPLTRRRLALRLLRRWLLRLNHHLRLLLLLGNQRTSWKTSGPQGAGKDALNMNNAC